MALQTCTISPVLTFVFSNMYYLPSPHSQLMAISFFTTTLIYKYQSSLCPPSLYYPLGPMPLLDPIPSHLLSLIQKHSPEISSLAEHFYQHKNKL